MLEPFSALPHPSWARTRQLSGGVAETEGGLPAGDGHTLDRADRRACRLYVRADVRQGVSSSRGHAAWSLCATTYESLLGARWGPANTPKRNGRRRVMIRILHCRHATSHGALLPMGRGLYLRCTDERAEAGGIRCAGVILNQRVRETSAGTQLRYENWEGGRPRRPMHRCTRR